MNKNLTAIALAVVAAPVIYLGGWEIIEFVGDQVFSFPWNFGEIIVLSLMSMFLIIFTVVAPYKIYKKILTPKKNKVS